MYRTILCIVILLCLNLSSSFAQNSITDGSIFSGLVYSDYYWMANHHNAEIEGNNGFWFRRIYLTHDYKFNDRFSSRFRLEAANPGDFESGGEMVPEVKDAYLKWQNDRHQILAGISSSPTFGLTEDVWGYRSIEKAPQDLYDFGSSRDFGISLKGQIDESARWNYHFFFGNGEGNNAEVNRGKKVMGALAYNITEHIVVEIYADYYNSAEDPEARDYFTAQGFAAYQSDKLNIGLLYSSQQREAQLGTPSVTLDLVSIFGNYRITKSVKGYLRADHLFDGYHDGSENSYIPFAESVESTFLVGGVDILLSENIHLMPNIESVIYGKDAFGQSPDTDIIPRLTLFYEF